MEFVETTEELTHRYATALVPLTVIVGLFVVLGVVGNIIVLIVFYFGRAYRRNNYRVFVISFAIVDLFASAILFPTEIIRHRSDFNFRNVVLCQMKIYINNYGAVAGALSLLVISVDRFRKVVFPLKTQMSQTLAIKLCVGLTFIFSSIINVPVAFMTDVLQSNMTNIYGTNTTVFTCSFDEDFRGHPIAYIYQAFTALLLLGVSISTIIMYTCIGCQIYKHRGMIPPSFKGRSTRDNSFTSDTIHSSGTTTQTSDDKAATELKVTFTANKDETEENMIPREPGSVTNEVNRTDIKRPPLVKQGSSSFDHPERKKMLAKQHSQHSSSSLGSRSPGSRRNKRLTRQGSGFGIQQFPYKTLIWFILTIVFISTNILSLCISVTGKNLFDMTPSEYATHVCLHRLYYINSVINFFVYVILDKHFRSVCRNLGPRLKSRFAQCYN